MFDVPARLKSVVLSQGQPAGITGGGPSNEAGSFNPSATAGVGG
jgi:hypothetical protein